MTGAGYAWRTLKRPSQRPGRNRPYAIGGAQAPCYKACTRSQRKLKSLSFRGKRGISLRYRYGQRIRERFPAALGMTEFFIVCTIAYVNLRPSKKRPGSSPGLFYCDLRQRLEVNLQAELNLAWIGGSSIDYTRVVCHTAVRVENRFIVERWQETWVVEGVEHIDAELRRDPLVDAKVLEDREVHVKQTRANDLVSSKVADQVLAVD